MKDNFIEFACRMIVWKIRYKWHTLMIKYWDRKWYKYNHKHLAAWHKVLHHTTARAMIVNESNVYAERRNQQIGTGS